MTRPRYIEWTDESGRLNVLDTVPLEFPVDVIMRHPFDPVVRHYLDGPKSIETLGPCWCQAPELHPVHAPLPVEDSSA